MREILSWISSFICKGVSLQIIETFASNVEGLDPLLDTEEL